jgi:hypothetical protein
VIPGSQDLFSPRWSPDGRYLAAMNQQSTKLLLYDFKTQKWSDWTSELIGFPTGHAMELTCITTVLSPTIRRFGGLR